MNHKKKITNGKFTVNTQNLSDSERARILREQKAREKVTDFKLSGDMAEQFNESQEDDELYDDQNPDGL